MQANEETLKMLASCFFQTLSPEPEPRRQAEAYLKQAANQPGFGVTVLSLLMAPTIEDQIRTAAAVSFKNHVKYRWSPTDADVDKLGELVAIQEPEKEAIKTHLVDLMLSSPPAVQRQLADALASISSHDFPAKWQSLLPSLVVRLQTLLPQDPKSTAGVLATANSIFKRFRHAFKSPQLYLELKYCLDLFALPSLEVFKVVGEQVRTGGGGDKEVQRWRLESLRLVARIFYSLNAQELPEVFEDAMREWMGEFHAMLGFQDEGLESEKGDQESVLDSLKSAICENINLYMEKNEEEFKDFLPTFVKSVWDLLMRVSPSPRHDHLAVTAIRFLTTVSVSVHHGLFSDPETLRSVCEGIVIPNVVFRDEDEELFEMNYVEYIRRDMEGSDSDTRRRMACELVKGLATHHEQPVTDLFSRHVSTMLAKYATSASQFWREKDSALYLVVALAVRQKTPAQGATSVSQLVNIPDFFQAQILPELSAADVNDCPVLKADALKFLGTFRSQLAKETCFRMLPELVRFLGAESNVVHSYAAICLERFLVVTEEVPGERKKKRFGEEEIGPIAERLLGGLFGALRMPDSQENPYVMKAIMRVLSCAPIGPLAPQVMAELSKTLLLLCLNPKNPTFNHYAFEAVAALIRKTSQSSASASSLSSFEATVSSFETSLFPVLQTVLAEDVQEFAPYVFQVLALLIECRRGKLPGSYLAIFPALVSPALWERPANVPALVRLLQAYLQKAAPEILSANQLPPVLGVFQKLVVSKHSDHHGFFVLNTLVESLETAALQPYLKQIWSLLFHRMQGSRTPKFVKALLVFSALFVAKHGAPAVTESVNSVQPGIFLQLLDPVWISVLPSVSGDVESKLCAVAATKLLTESAELQSDNALQLWARLLDATLTLLVKPEEERLANEEEDVPELEEVPGYTAVFAQLYNAGKKEEDPIPEISNAKEYLAKGLGSLSGRFPGKYLRVIQGTVQQANLEALQQFCSAYGVTIS